MRLIAAISAVCSVAACTGGRDAALAPAKRDTLPGGIERVVSDGPTAWRDSSGWRLVETSRITGGDSASGDLSRPSSGAIDAAGRLYVADDQPTVIKVFDRDGRFVRTIGREGEGPGEYRTVILAVHDSSLVVFDPRLARLSVFDTSGRFVRSFASLCCNYSAISIDRAGRIAVRFGSSDKPGYTGGFIRSTVGGALVDTVWVPKDGEPKYLEVTTEHSQMRMSIPYTPAPVREMAEDGRVIHGWTGDYRLAVSQSGSDTAQIFGRAWTPVELPEAMRTAWYEGALKNLTKQYGAAKASESVSLDMMPRTATAVQSVSVDPDGYRWISVFSADTMHGTIDIFDRGGAYLGPIRTPWGRSHYVIARGAAQLAVYGETADGFPEIVRYRVDRGMH